MGPKQIDVTCPCCSTILTVDVLTAQVLRRTEPREDGAKGQGESRWGAAEETVEGRQTSAQDKLDQALAEERGKEAHLDDLFRKAQEKLTKKDKDDR
jgi:hypothetical protein